MVKLLLGVVIEAFVGVALAGLILAIVVPMLDHFRSIRHGDLIPMGVISGVILSVVAIVVARPGSAINRWRRAEPTRR